MNVSAVQMGMDLVSEPRKAHADYNGSNLYSGYNDSWPRHEENKDYFIEKNGVKYAGTHLIIDLWGATNLENMEVMENALRKCVTECKATLLHIHLHHFEPNGGISGVAVLAESHISVHTWPEREYAAFDVFMCGEAEPHKAIEVLRKAFLPERVDATEHLRGRVD
jgi:S-adenosylmethionine decarboxylase